MIPRSAAQDQEVNSSRADEVFAEHGGSPALVHGSGFRYLVRTEHPRAGAMHQGRAGAVASTRFLDSMLFDVSALAPWAFIAPALALSVAAALTAWIPAARAGSLPPAQVLRSD